MEIVQGLVIIIIDYILVNSDSLPCFWRVAFTSLVTFPGCLIHGFPSNCWCAPLHKEPGQQVARSVAGKSWCRGIW